MSRFNLISLNPFSYIKVLIIYLEIAFNFIMYFSSVNRYASRVRSIVNDPNKNISSKEIARLKKLVAYWKEQAGRKGDDEDLEEIEEERTPKDRTDSRHSM